MNYFLDNNILKIDISSLYCNTIQEFFDIYIPSKKIQHLLIQNKWITLDGNPVKRESDIVGVNLLINIYPENNNYKEVENTSVQIVYEDEFICVLNKPKGVLVHSDGGLEITLSDMLQSHYFQTPYISCQPLHRLDKETSGLVVFSKSIVFQPLLDKLLSEKQIRRNYLAFCQGKCEINKTFTIDKPIGKDRHNSNKMVITNAGQQAKTKAKCLLSNKNTVLFRCMLDSGKTHQIRVHLASIGYPILNDDLYGVSSSKIIRMGLFADNIEMYHPIKEENITIDCDLPNDLLKLYNSME